MPKLITFEYDVHFDHGLIAINSELLEDVWALFYCNFQFMKSSMSIFKCSKIKHSKQNMNRNRFIEFVKSINIELLSEILQK
jgi:hypothetical protein